LLAESGRRGAAGSASSAEGRGLEAAADWRNLETPETYLGHARAERFAGPGRLAADARRDYTVPDRLQRNRWALGGGRWVVLYFYPKDDTPGCTTEACNFRDDLPAMRALNVQILGISLDDTKSHAAFARKYQLPFPLLADTEGKVARAYDTLWSIGPLRIARRHTFVIDPEGHIAKIYRNVNPASHSRELQQALKQMQKESSRAHSPTPQ
jgi:peroxiredoxin Q/BCP